MSAHSGFKGYLIPGVHPTCIYLIHVLIREVLTISGYSMAVFIESVDFLLLLKVYMILHCRCRGDHLNPCVTKPKFFTVS